MKQRTAVTVAAAGMLAVTLFAPSASATSSAGGGPQTLKSYSNCTELNKDFKHGISDKRKSKTWWVKRGATAKGAHRAALYSRVQSSMDRDGDHIACEK